MRPILYDQNERNFVSNGLGILYDAVECIVKEQRNGLFELEMKYPIQGDYASDLEKNRYIRAKPNDEDDTHIFRIYETKVSVDNNTIEVKAVSKISDDLSATLIRPFTVGTLSLNEIWPTIVQNAIDPINIRFNSDLGSRSSFNNDKLINALNLIIGSDDSLVSTFGGEVKRTDKELFIYRGRGREHITTIRPRKNMKNIQLKTSMHGKFTRILPYARYTPEGENQKEQTIYGDIIKSDHYDDYDIKRIVPIDISNKFNDYKQKMKSDRKTRLAAERENNRSADSSKRAQEQSQRERLEQQREEERERNYYANKQKRASAHANRGAKKSAAQREAEWQQREAARDAAFEASKQKRNQNKQKRQQSKADREAEKQARLARQQQIKEDTKIVITSRMVTEEASTYFDENPTVDIPDIKMEVSMIPIQDTTSWEKSILRSLEAVRLCDTVDVYLSKIDVDVTVQIVEIEYDVLKERTVKIVASSDGNTASTLADSQRAEWKDLTKKTVNEAMGDFEGSINTILTSANGKNRNFYGPDEPPVDDLKENDLWFRDVGAGETDLYRYDGTQWNLVMPHDFGEVLEDKIDTAMSEIHESLDAFETDIEVVIGDINETHQYVKDSVDAINKSTTQEINLAKSKLEQLSNEFVADKRRLDGDLASIRSQITSSGTSVLNETKKLITSLDNGISEKFSNLKVGATNILRNTQTMSAPYYRGIEITSTPPFKVYDYVLNHRAMYNNYQVIYGDSSEDLKTVLKPNTDYVFSFYTKTNERTKKIDLSFPAGINITERDSDYSSGWTSNTDLTRHWVKVRTNNTAIKFRVAFSSLVNDAIHVYIAGIQLEEATIVSDYHPNELDFQESFAEYKRTNSQSLTTIQNTISVVNNDLTQTKSKLNQTDSKLTQQVAELVQTKTKLDQTASKLELQVTELTKVNDKYTKQQSELNLIPGKIDLAVTSAKDEVKRYSDGKLIEGKQYTDSRITINNESITQRITSTLNATVNNVVTTAVTQTKNSLTQAITQSATDTLTRARTDAQTLITTEITGVKKTISSVQNEIPKKYGSRNYLSGTIKPRESYNYTLNSNNYAVLWGYPFMYGSTPKELGIPQGARLIIQYEVQFKSNVTNASVIPELYNETEYLGGVNEIVSGYSNPTVKDINGTTKVFKIGYMTLSDNAWNRANQIRFRVDMSNNVPFTISKCTLYYSDMVSDWSPSAEDLMDNTTGVNLIRNGDFLYNIQPNQNISTQFWNIIKSPGWDHDNGTNGLNNYGKKGIFHYYGTPSQGNYPCLVQDINEPVYKGQPLTLSADISCDAISNSGVIMRMEIHGFWNEGGTDKVDYVYKDFYPSDIQFMGMKARERVFHRIGAVLTPRHDYKNIRVKITSMPNVLVNFYIRRIQLERGNSINDFKDNPQDLDMTQTVKFQKVEESVDFFKRTLGETQNGIANRVSQMIMSSTEIQSLITSGSSASNNLILGTEDLVGVTNNSSTNAPFEFSPSGGAYGKRSFFIKVDKGAPINRWNRLMFPLSIKSLNQGDVLTFTCKVRMHKYYHTPNQSLALIEIKYADNIPAETLFYIPRNYDVNSTVNNPYNGWIDVKKTITISKDMIFNIGEYVNPFRVLMDGSGLLEIKEMMLVRGDKIASYQPSGSISSTMVQQLANSYSVKILKNERDLVTQISANPNGVRISGKNIEITGQTSISNGVIGEAHIRDGSIKNAHIADATIASAKIISVDVRKITGLEAEFRNLVARTGVFESVFTNGLTIANRTRMTINNDRLFMQHLGGQTDNITIQSNGRYAGPTRFWGRATSSSDYVPVMTNAYKNTPLVSHRNGVGIYGVRGLFLLTFANSTNEYGSHSWLYVNDGSDSDAIYYAPLAKSETQTNWNNGFT
mgnify:FL=1